MQALLGLVPQQHSKTVVKMRISNRWETTTLTTRHTDSKMFDRASIGLCPRIYFVLLKFEDNVGIEFEVEVQV